jgi:hypothetical protein
VLSIRLLHAWRHLGLGPQRYLLTAWRKVAGARGLALFNSKERST